MLSLPARSRVFHGSLMSVRISRFFAGGLAGAAVVVTLSGCVGVPALTIYGGLTERCFETRTTDDGFFALVGVTVTNESSRTMILREAAAIELVNATVGEIAIVPVPSAYSVFGDAPGGHLTPAQRPLWNDRIDVEGAVVEAGGTLEVVVELQADDYTQYSGLNGLRLKYDDGWFSATSVADATVGFVPPWSHCGSRAR